jgi:hypothetical protein
MTKSNSYYFYFGSALSNLSLFSGVVSTSSTFLNPSSGVSCFAIKFLMWKINCLAHEEMLFGINREQREPNKIKAMCML